MRKSHESDDDERRPRQPCGLFAQVYRPSACREPPARLSGATDAVLALCAAGFRSPFRLLALRSRVLHGKPKFHLARHVTFRHDTYEVSSLSSRACSNMAADEEAVVLACRSLVFFCSGFASISGTTTGEVRWKMDMSIPVHSVATPLNTCRANRACRACCDEPVAPCCPKSATRLVTPRHDLSLCQNAWPR